MPKQVYPDKPIVWIGSVLKDVRNLPDNARRKAGFELRALQRGQEPSDFKRMPILGPNVFELRVSTGDAFRLFYVAKYDEAVYVLHAFQKKSRKTSKQDILIGKNRLKTMQRLRNARTRDGHE